MYQQQWTSNKYDKLITLDNNAISGIWKYVSILTVSLMTKIKRNKQVNPLLFLKNIQNLLDQKKNEEKRKITVSFYRINVLIDYQLLLKNYHQLSKQIFK